ncbi:hypothetical protein [Photorhabdus cinerea]|uniref:Uncharacterized protein n=2 Tax=Morganellaceae TaxID=1903414 RepID=A0A7X5QEU2_9GAMM|nr:hypothetical protein [Photorhabdus cinerea]NHB93119.1 hypothetical protein [Photorhabdus cinerea]
MGIVVIYLGIMRLTSHNGFLNSEERAMSFTLGTVGFYRYIYLAKNAVIAAGWIFDIFGRVNEHNPSR